MGEPRRTRVEAGGEHSPPAGTSHSHGSTFSFPHSKAGLMKAALLLARPVHPSWMKFKTLKEFFT